MDGAGDLLTRLRAALAPFDDEAFAALANKGLVRRARKDLESTRPVILGAEVDRLRLEVGDAVVMVDPTPSRSTCSCPAEGTCRHILAALIFLRESGPATEPSAEDEAPPAPTVSPADEILAIADETLSKWAGKALVSRMMTAMARGLPVEFDEAGAIVARFPTRNVTCRWMPGGGPSGMVCSCHAADACEHKVAAILAFQAERGGRKLAEPEEPRGASADAPRTRAEVLESVARVTRQMVGMGVSRPSRAAAERLRTLAVSAHGVDLPRLERSLRALADGVEQGLARSAQADAARLFARAAEVEALAHALAARPTHSLIGEHRSQYEPVGDVEVVGMGARRWRSPSGYEGLTVIFWDRSANRWATWTEARPRTTGGIDPAQRYDSDGPWIGVASPATAVRHVLRLSGTYRNRHGRLSGRPGTRAFPLGPAEPRSVPGRIVSWTELAERARSLFGGGFRDRSEQDELVLLAPEAWGPAEFDPVRQELTRLVFDADGRALPLVLRHDPETPKAVESLENYDTTAVHAVLGLLRLGDGGLAVEPIALHGAKGVFNLTLDSAVRTASARPTAIVEAPPEDDGDELDEGDAPAPSSTRVGMLLDAVAAHLEAAGEGGLAAFRPVATLRGLADRAEALGLSTCGRAVGWVVEHLERQRRGEDVEPGLAARDLLRAYHLVRLAASQEAVATATARFVAQPSASSASSAPA